MVKNIFLFVHLWYVCTNKRISFLYHWIAYACSFLSIASPLFFFTSLTPAIQLSFLSQILLFQSLNYTEITQFCEHVTIKMTKKRTKTHTHTSFYVYCISYTTMYEFCAIGNQYGCYTFCNIAKHESNDEIERSADGGGWNHNEICFNSYSELLLSSDIENECEIDNQIN